MSNDRLLSYGELWERGVRYSARHIARLEAAGEFPRHARRPDRRSGWRASEIDRWLIEHDRDAPREAA